MKALTLLLLVATLFCATEGKAFPELSRHGYANCIACHVSPTGGGVLSEYGRALSKDLLSTWGRPGEENFLWSIPTIESVALGGDFRSVSVKDKTAATGATREFWIQMQRDLEVALTHQKFTFDFTIGVEDTRENGVAATKNISRRHYLLYRHNEEWTYRFGRFFPAFGILIADHNTTIRRGITWDQGMESYNLEAALQGETWHHFFTLVGGRPDDKKLIREKGFSYSTAYHPNTSTKLGVSYYYGSSEEINQHKFGPFAIWGINDQFYLMGQLNAVRAFPYTSTEHQWGLVDYLRFNYEAYRGVHLYLQQEFAQTDMNQNSTRTDTHSLGFQFFPRPHFELQVVAQKAYSQGLGNTPNDRLNVMWHYYP